MKKTSVRIFPGHVFGRLTVVSRAANRHGRLVWWQCLCDCGNITEVYAQLLRLGKTKSCGCLRREATGAARRTHAMSSTRTYNIWGRMIQRCTNPNDSKWLSYGGRGIKVCDRWLDAAAFLADMGEAPAGLSIDRIDVDGDYEPGNCRWATQREQMRNTRGTKYFELGGVRRSLPDWCDMSGVRAGLVRERLARGWDFKRALTEPRK